MSFIDPLTGTMLPSDPAEIDDPNAQLALDEGGYNPPTVETDQDAIAQQVFTDLAGRVPGWQAHDGNLDTWMVEAFAEVGAEIRSLAVDVPESIFTTYGQLVLGIPPGLAVAATGLATFTATDDAGYTLDVSSTFAIARSGDDLVAFQTLAEATVAPGDTEVDNVPFAAVIVGADANGLSGAGQMLDPITWVASVTVPQPTINGADAETPEAYLDRLSNLLRMVALRPVLPQDFAILALQNEGVGRAVAMNLYDPATDTWDNARTVTLVLAQADGTPCTAEVKAAVETQLEALREVNWVINIIDPDYVALDVDFTVTAFAGQNADQVLATAIANVTDYLQPAHYRLGQLSPAIAGGEVISPPSDASPPAQWIRVNELVALLDRTLGVDWVAEVLINGAAADYQLPSLYTLPQPGAITGTVNLP